MADRPQFTFYPSPSVWEWLQAQPRKQAALNALAEAHLAGVHTAPALPEATLWARLLAALADIARAIREQEAREVTQ